MKKCFFFPPLSSFESGGKDESIVFRKRSKRNKKSGNCNNLKLSDVKQFIRFSGNINCSTSTSFLSELDKQFQFSSIELEGYLKFVEYLLDGLAKA